MNINLPHWRLIDSIENFVREALVPGSLTLLIEYFFSFFDTYILPGETEETIYVYGPFENFKCKPRMLPSETSVILTALALETRD